MKGFQNKNSFHIDLGVHGILFAVHYERIIINNRLFKTAGQIGISYFPPIFGNKYLWIPLEINEICSFKNHHIEAGFGMVVIRETDWGGLLSGRIGYRYQKPSGRFIFRVGLTPVFESNLVDVPNGFIKLLYLSEFNYFPGVSIGYSF